MPGCPGGPGGPSINPVGKPLLSDTITGARDAKPFSPLRPWQTTANTLKQLVITVGKWNTIR